MNIIIFFFKNVFVFIVLKFLSLYASVFLSFPSDVCRVKVSSCGHARRRWGSPCAGRPWAQASDLPPGAGRHACLVSCLFVLRGENRAAQAWICPNAFRENGCVWIRAGAGQGPVVVVVVVVTAVPESSLWRLTQRLVSRFDSPLYITTAWAKRSPLNFVGGVFLQGDSRCPSGT